MIRKCIMTTVVVFLGEGPQQLAAAFAVTIVYLLVFIATRPYAENNVDNLQTLALFIQAFALFCKDALCYVSLQLLLMH